MAREWCQKSIEELVRMYSARNGGVIGTSILLPLGRGSMYDGNIAPSSYATVTFTGLDDVTNRMMTHVKLNFPMAPMQGDDVGPDGPYAEREFGAVVPQTISVGDYRYWRVTDIRFPIGTVVKCNGIEQTDIAVTAYNLDNQGNAAYGNAHKLTITGHLPFALTPDGHETKTYFELEYDKI